MQICFLGIADIKITLSALTLRAEIMKSPRIGIFVNHYSTPNWGNT